VLLLEQRIENTQNMAHMRMNVARNRLLMLGTLLNLVTICIGMATVVTAFFGTHAWVLDRDRRYS
jgi:hypothetical protein